MISFGLFRGTNNFIIFPLIIGVKRICCFHYRMGPHASFSHQTLPSRSNVTGSNQTSAFGSSRGAMHQSFGGKFYNSFYEPP